MFREDFWLHLVFILCFRPRSVISYDYAKPIAKTLWPERCATGMRILNDCNWCVCNRQQTFTCTARVCSGVDMFGHFKDSVREHLLGMEGHGSWRSSDTICGPHSHYQRDGLLCICNEDGNWPNPVCRDLFRVMHDVELTNTKIPSPSDECKPTKLYLYGCNVCICPSTSRIDPNLCTLNNCTVDDPVFLTKEEVQEKSDKQEVEEVYAECELNRKYIIGCRQCICLKNNRLICDNCNPNAINGTDKFDGKKEPENYCSHNEPYKLFNIDCNICTCDPRSKLYCTTKRCLKDYNKPKMELSKAIDITLRTVESPIDDLDCTPGTKYEVDCNTCFCTETGDDKIRILSCTMNVCENQDKSVLNAIKTSCVENSVYESNCLLCRCDVVDGVKRESCLVDSKCETRNVQDSDIVDLNSLHGYCEPSHIYKKDCNTCHCLSDGKVVACTDKICTTTEDQPIIIDIVPVTQKGGRTCPRDHMYKIDCNFCFCLSNGNVLCTAAKCDD